MDILDNQRREISTSRVQFISAVLDICKDELNRSLPRMTHFSVVER